MASVVTDSQPGPNEPGTACLQDRLEQSAMVTSRLSHDFGNYLTGIMGFTELSLSQATADTPLHRFLTEVLQSAREGADWIRRLHLFCRRGASEAWPCLLTSVLAETEIGLRNAGVSSLRWEAKCPDDLPLLAIDAGSLQTALTEVATNAQEAMQDQGTLTLSARTVELTEADVRELLGALQPGRHVEIAITDNGPGIAADVRARLFRDIFLSTKPRHRGLGLLAVYGILHRFHGGLKMAEPIANQGASIRFYIPVANVECPALSADAAPPRVLLVHAIPLLFDSMRRILEAHGCTVETAVASPTTRAALPSPGQSFGLIIVETALPQKSGFDLARRILEQDRRARFLFIHTPASFHGLAEEDLLKRFDILRWPLDPPAFLQAVQTALGRTMPEPGAGNPSR